VVHSRERQAEILEQQRLVEKEIEKVQAEHAQSRDALAAHRDRLEVARKILPDALKELPALLALVPDASPTERAEITKAFLERIPKMEIKL
jgi:hypothetical protein